MCKTPGFEPKVMDSMQDKTEFEQHMERKIGASNARRRE
jgi:hypothetical protein